jgi:hypothetical protein
MLIVQVKITEVAAHLFFTISAAVFKLNLLAAHHNCRATGLFVMNAHSVTPVLIVCNMRLINAPSASLPHRPQTQIGR